MKDELNFFEPYGEVIAASSRNVSNTAKKNPMFLSEPTVTMAYVPMQYMDTLYDSEQGLQNGTIFPQLNKPFKGRSVV